MIKLSTELAIDKGLEVNITALKESFFDFLAALLLAVVAVVSLLYGALRLVFSFLGLILWGLSLLTMLLYSCRAWAVARSSARLIVRGDAHDNG